MKGREMMGAPSAGERGGGKALLLSLEGREGGVEGGEAITAGGRLHCWREVGFNGGSVTTR